MDKETVLKIIWAAYGEGKFPMAKTRDAEEVHLYEPLYRGQLPIADLHISRKLKKTVGKCPYEVRIDTDFAGVIDGCADVYKNREVTWINGLIRDVFIELHEQGHAHSVEVWDMSGDAGSGEEGGEEGRLVGGLYGLAVGSVFCGESMFSRATDASKIALVHLCARLWKGGFEILDTQFVNDHLQQFGVYEIPREEYLQKLAVLKGKQADFMLPGLDETELVQDYLKNRDAAKPAPQAARSCNHKI